MAGYRSHRGRAAHRRAIHDRAPAGHAYRRHHRLDHARARVAGTHVAYLEHPHVNDDAGELRIVELATRTQTTLAADWASITGLAWDGDGARYAYSYGQELSQLFLMTI